jgi:hypothetical protein
MSLFGAARSALRTRTGPFALPIARPCLPGIIHLKIKTRGSMRASRKESHLVMWLLLSFVLFSMYVVVVIVVVMLTADASTCHPRGTIVDSSSPPPRVPPCLGRWEGRKEVPLPLGSPRPGWKDDASISRTGCHQLRTGGRH